MSFTIEFSKLCNILFSSKAKSNKSKLSALISKIKTEKEKLSASKLLEVRKCLVLTFLPKFNKYFKDVGKKKDRFIILSSFFCPLTESNKKRKPGLQPKRPNLPKSEKKPNF